jgi:hypothetical protein
VISIAVGVISQQPGAVMGGVEGIIPILTGATASKINVSDLTGSLQVLVKGVDGVSSWLTAADLAALKPDQVQEIKSLSGGLDAAVRATVSFLNAEMAATQADTARYQNLNTQYQGIVKQLVQDVAALQSLGRDAVTAALHTAAATARRQANQVNADRLNGLATTLQAGLRQLMPGVRQLLATARTYQDVVSRYVFLATRAAEIWTLTDLPVSFTAGYVYPDDEENAFFDVEYPSGADTTNNAAALLGYATQSAGAWAYIPELPNQQAIDRYDQNLNETDFFVHVSDPAALAALRSRGSMTFDLTADAIPAGRAELKLLGLRLALVGAAAADPSFDCLVTHGGDATVTMVDGTTRVVQAPAAGPVLVTAQTAAFTTGPATFVDVRQQFWGRSPQTRWTVAVDRATIDGNGVDLSGVTEVVMRLQAGCLLVPASPSSAGSPVGAAVGASVDLSSADATPAAAPDSVAATSGPE